MKKLVASGAIAHAGTTVSAVAVFDAMVCSCPAPRPRVIRATAPRYALGAIWSEELPTVLAESSVAAHSGCSSWRQ